MPCASSINTIIMIIAIKQMGLERQAQRMETERLEQQAQRMETKRVEQQAQRMGWLVKGEFIHSLFLHLY